MVHCGKLVRTMTKTLIGPDVLRALADGKRIREASWDTDEYIHLTEDGNLINETGHVWASNFSRSWELVDD